MIAHARDAASIDGATVAAIIAIAIAVEAIIAGLLALIFRRQFISERAELRTIQDSATRLRYLTDSLARAMGSQAVVVEFQDGLIARLMAATGTAAALPAVDDQLRMMRRDVDRGTYELLLLTGDDTAMESAARHLAQACGTVRSLEILRWVVMSCANERLRSRLNEEIHHFEQRLDSASTGNLIVFAWDEQ